MNKKKNKIVCIIQARLSSKRLPRKVLMDIEGKTCIERVIERVKKSKLIDEIWLATTYLTIDQNLKKICDENKIHFFKAVIIMFCLDFLKFQKLPMQVIVRITGDCPLIDWKIIDEMIEKLK